MAHRLGEIALVFARLGATAFGGPAAHIALMRHEFVERRRWEDEAAFTDLVGLTALLPGPNSTELAIELGRRRAGRAGLLVAGVAFIGPAVAIVMALAWAYDRYGTTPAVADLRYGIVPVIVAIIVHAVVKLSRSALTSPLTVVVAASALAGFLVGVDELLLLAGGALATVLWANRHRLRPPRGSFLFFLFGGTVPLAQASGTSTGTPEITLVQLFWSFLRIGATLFGSGYVIVAFLEAEFVERLGVITQQELLDAVSVGQVTPGPVFTTATFIGYLLHGPVGAIVASVAIFLPAFLLVLALGGPLERLLRRPGARAVLAGLNAAALGLIAGAALRLAGEGLTDPFRIAVSCASLAALLLTGINPTWLIAAGAAVGGLHLLLA